MSKIEQDAARWNFMMLVADYPDGYEAAVIDRLGNEIEYSNDKESMDMCKLVDAAILAVNAGAVK